MQYAEKVVGSRIQGNVVMMVLKYVKKVDGSWIRGDVVTMVDQFSNSSNSRNGLNRSTDELPSVHRGSEDENERENKIHCVTNFKHV